MAKMIKEDECPAGLPGWLATFGDLMSLLLTFFVLLLSFSTMSVVDFNNAMGAMQGALGVLTGEPQLSLPIRQSKPRSEGNLQQAEVIAKAAKEIDAAIEEAGLQGDVEIEESTTGLIIRVADKLFFETADAVIKGDARSILNKLGAILAPLPNKINVQGHSDNRPINTDRYASNWELSGMRALRVAQFFINNSGISPDRLSITGYSEYRPLVPNNSESRMARNRRVELHVLYDEAPDAPPSKLYDAIEKQGIQIEGRNQNPE